MCVLSAREAVKWYRKAAEQGDDVAQCRLGLCYVEGEGVEKNLAESIKWFAKAANQDNGAAQLFLGVCYENGIGVKLNKDTAIS